MSDFHQFGPVTALPLLAARSTDEMERRLESLAERVPVTLVVPLVPSEMERPALAGILDELSRVRYLDSLVLSLNHASFDDYHRAVAYFERYPGRKVLLWNESPAIEAFIEEMAAAGLNTGDPGKGRACWLAIGHVLAEDRAAYVAFQDADVLNFSRAMLARLVLPAVEPTVDFDFVKAYYARVTDRLHGRVTRLLLTPLLAAFTRLIGQDPYIRYLSSFRYALSGEFAVQCDLAERMRLPCDWGLEIVTLFEALRHRNAGRICQVEIADRYEHKHPSLSADDPGRGLNRMARDVVKHLLRTLAAAGVNLSPGLLMSLLAAYQREAEDAVADSYAVATINGLSFDRHAEERIIQVFNQALRAATEEFLADPLGPSLVPNWVRVWAGVPDAGARLMAAVAKGDASVRREWR
ncbi:MAG TPA: glycosyl transferase [Vicinamibacteria bacterium]|nr:glycosyl transferase [Vicinamibacteria bacterium]